MHCMYHYAVIQKIIHTIHFIYTVLEWDCSLLHEFVCANRKLAANKNWNISYIVLTIFLPTNQSPCWILVLHYTVQTNSPSRKQTLHHLIKMYSLYIVYEWLHLQQTSYVNTILLPTVSLAFVSLVKFTSTIYKYKRKLKWSYTCNAFSKVGQMVVP